MNPILFAVILVSAIGLIAGLGLAIASIVMAVPVDEKAEMKEIVMSVYNSLMVKGYNPINQLVGYILSEDPTYITNYNNARQLICKVDRDFLLQELLRVYLEK